MNRSDVGGKPIAALQNTQGKGDKGKGDGKSKGSKGGKDKGKEGKGVDPRGKGKGTSEETRTCFTCNQRGHLSSDCPHRAKGDKQGKGSKGSKGAEKGSKGEKGRKGDSKGGKPKGKRATEFSSFQPESEAGIVVRARYRRRRSIVSLG